MEFVFDASLVGSENEGGFDATAEGNRGGSPSAAPLPTAGSEAQFAAATRTVLATLDGVALRDIAHIHISADGDSVGVAVEFDVPFAQPSLFLNRHIAGCGVCVAHSGSRFCAHNWDSQACVDPLPCRTSPCLNKGVCIPVGGGIQQESVYEDLLSKSLASATASDATSPNSTAASTTARPTTGPDDGRDYACVCGAGFSGSRCGIVEPTTAATDVFGISANNGDGGSIFAVSPPAGGVPGSSTIVTSADSATKSVGMIAGIVLFVCVAVIAAVLYFRRLFRIQNSKAGLERMNGMKVFGIDAENASSMDWDGGGTEVGNLLAQSPVMMLQSPDGTMIPVSPVRSPRLRFPNGGMTQSERGASMRSGGAGWGHFHNSSPLSPQKYAASEPPGPGEEPMYDTVVASGGKEMAEMYKRASMFGGDGGDSAIYNAGMFSGNRRPSPARSNNDDVYAKARRKSQRFSSGMSASPSSSRRKQSGAIPNVTSSLGHPQHADSPASSDGGGGGGGGDPFYGLASPNDARSSNLWRGGSKEGDEGGGTGDGASKARGARSPFVEEPIYDQAQFTAASRLLLAQDAVAGSSRHSQQQASRKAPNNSQSQQQARKGTARDPKTSSPAPLPSPSSKMQGRTPTLELSFGGNAAGDHDETESDYDISTVAHLIGRGSETPLGRGGDGSFVSSPAADPVYATASETVGSSMLEYEPVYSTASDTLSASELLGGGSVVEHATDYGTAEEHIYSTASESGAGGVGAITGGKPKVAHNGTQRRRVEKAAEALYDTASNVGHDILDGIHNPIVESEEEVEEDKDGDMFDEESDYDFSTVGHLVRSVTSPPDASAPQPAAGNDTSRLKSAMTWHTDVDVEEDEA